MQGEDGLYSDHILPNGIIEPKVWSYNQGSMIGAGVLLHQATGDTSYLEQAVRTASASTVHYADVTTLSAELPAFAAIYFRNLLFLDAIRPDPTFRALAETYAATMWERRRDPVSGLSTPVSLPLLRRWKALIAPRVWAPISSALRPSKWPSQARSAWMVRRSGCGTAAMAAGNAA